MKGYILAYVNENEYHKLERALEKWSKLSYNELNSELYSAFRGGRFLGEKVSSDESVGTITYETVFLL